MYADTKPFTPSKVKAIYFLVNSLRKIRSHFHHYSNIFVQNIFYIRNMLLYKIECERKIIIHVVPSIEASSGSSCAALRRKMVAMKPGDELE